ncbi:DUF4190 domain-containing protein [Brevibacterium spongiae]|uniref:DUF4190 domain-containing protein n=1 Tax=Brevibacterium spongiae TaxID=2909672 RepID=A0ABY5SL59_9MICO|nr:DUF4190 domain-containing protein [Brevibacterium spongiae]UVI35212.1 DUF4190 domain-containing protein [Brevibacterium spongiae]
MNTRVLPIRNTGFGSNRAPAPAPMSAPAPVLAPAPVPVHAPVTYGNAAPVVVYQQIAPTNSAAIVSLVLGLISFTTSMFFLGIVGIIFGHIARSQIKKRGERGNGMAVAGLWLSYVSVIFWIVFWLAYFGIIALAIGLGIAAESGAVS